jgi:mono/diheme cytochrome c family protein
MPAARLPWGWIAVLGAGGLVAGLGLGYLRAQGGGESPLRGSAQAPAPLPAPDGAAASATAAGIPGDEPAIDPGRAAYVMCQGCHQIDGHGMAGFAPPLAGSAIATGPAAPLILGVLDGVGGDDGWRATMPAQRDRLDDQQLAALLTYVRGAWGNHAAAVDPAAVAAARARPPHARAWTRGELSGVLP